MCESEIYENGCLDTFSPMFDFADDYDVGMYVTDYFTCEILFVNKKMSAYAGKADERSLLGRCCWTLLNAGLNERCSFCPYEKLMDNNGKPAPPYTWELYIPGHDIWIKVTNEVITWTDGRLAQKVIFYDITESKKQT